jgi:tetratricopeptide (TPR) repeat protein
LRPRERIILRLWGTQILLLVFFFLGQSEVWPAEEGCGQCIDESLQMDLADHFLLEGDYYRAITEYKRFLFFFPRSPRVEEALWKIARSYFKGKKWDEAISACDDLLKKNPVPSTKAEAFLLKGRAFVEKKDYSQARMFFQMAEEASPGPPLVDEAHWQIALTYVKEEKWREAADELRQIDRNSKLYPKGESFARGLDRIREIPQKSPEMAGFLAAILPGAGHLYTERYRDAAVAFLLNGVFIWGIVEAFAHDDYAIGGILTFFELGWYSGNIYSAVGSAQKYNRKKKQEYLDFLERGGNLSIGLSVQGKSPILSLRYDF